MINHHLKRSIELHESDGTDFAKLVTWHLCHGWVESNDRFFAMGYHSRNGSPEEPLSTEKADTVFCTMCAGDMRSAIEQFKGFEYLAFRRGFQNSPHVRVYRMRDFIQKLKS